MRRCKKYFIPREFPNSVIDNIKFSFFVSCIEYVQIHFLIVLEHLEQFTASS
jgi:hypothetical protein